MLEIITVQQRDLLVIESAKRLPSCSECKSAIHATTLQEQPFTLPESFNSKRGYTYAPKPSVARIEPFTSMYGISLSDSYQHGSEYQVSTRISPALFDSLSVNFNTTRTEAVSRADLPICDRNILTANPKQTKKATSP